MICRYLSSLSLDSWLAQKSAKCLMEENEWMSLHWRPFDDEPVIKAQRNEIITKALARVLENLEETGRYATTYEERVRIGIDEVK